MEYLPNQINDLGSNDFITSLRDKGKVTSFLGTLQLDGKYSLLIDLSYSSDLFL